MLNQELNRVVAIPIHMDYFYGLSPKKHIKGYARARNKQEGKTIVEVIWMAFIKLLVTLINF